MFKRLYKLGDIFLRGVYVSIIVDSMYSEVDGTLYELESVIGGVYSYEFYTNEELSNDLS